MIILGTGLGDKDGKKENVRFNNPKGISSITFPTQNKNNKFIDTNKNSFNKQILIADSENHKIKLFQVELGFVQTICGSTKGFSDGFGTKSQFNFPHSIVTSSKGEFAFVTDIGNQAIRQIFLQTKSQSQTQTKIQTKSIEVSTLLKFNSKFNFNFNFSSNFNQNIETNNFFFRPVGIAISPLDDFILVSGFGPQSSPKSHQILQINISSLEINTITH